MNKTTYEEAKECLRSINDFEDVYIEDSVTFRTTKQFDDKIKALENFLEQHRPPTFDEVVKAWEEEINDGFHGNYIVDIEITSEELRVAYMRDGGEILYTAFLMQIAENGWYRFFRGDGCYISDVAQKAINLTIRYLQSQKENAA